MPEQKNREMKIAMLGHKRIPSREGGVEIVVEELSTRMAVLGYDVTCFNRKGHHISGSKFDKEECTQYKGVSIKSVFTVNKGGLAAMSSSLFAAIRAAFGKFRVVHFHAEGPCAMLWLPKLFGKRCIATIHGLDHKRAKWGRFASAYIKLGEKCAVRFADEIIVLSRNVQKYFNEKYNRATVFIPNGVSSPQYIDDEVIKEQFSLKKNGYILFLGRLVPEKGITYLIDAFKGVKTDKKLVIAGGASDTEDFARELRSLSDGDDRIIFTDFVEGETLGSLYSNAYVYVLPSDLEGMPLSLLEAMSYKNCCLTSSIPECTEVVNEYGITFKKGDVGDLRDKLQFLCDDPATVDKYKSQAADYILDKYNWDTVVDETLRLYSVSDITDYKALTTEEKVYESLADK